MAVQAAPGASVPLKTDIEIEVLIARYFYSEVTGAEKHQLPRLLTFSPRVACGKYPSVAGCTHFGMDEVELAPADCMAASAFAHELYHYWFFIDFGNPDYDHRSILFNLKRSCLDEL
jgi:hypothetical protein